MKFTVVYLKVKQNKDGSVEFEGPVVGPDSETKEEADNAARQIVPKISA